jgi:hypothetical protein
VAGDAVTAAAAGFELLQFEEIAADFVFHVEWRVRQEFPEGVHYPGIVARQSPDGGLWHAATIGPADSGFLLAHTRLAGKEQGIDLRFQLERPRVRGANWWNAYEIHARGGRIRTWVNDGWTSDLMKCEVREGHLAIAALPLPIEYRRLSLKVFGPA